MKLRLPDDLRRRIEASAAANNRSVNAEIMNSLSNLYAERDALRDIVVETKRILEHISSWRDSLVASGQAGLIPLLPPMADKDEDDKQIAQNSINSPDPRPKSRRPRVGPTTKRGGTE